MEYELKTLVPELDPINKKKKSGETKREIYMRMKATPRRTFLYHFSRAKSQTQ